MKVLIACEWSGTVRDAFRERGHDAVSCDLVPADPVSSFHVQGNVLSIIDDTWDLMICHPPCTYLSYASNAWWTRSGRVLKRLDAAKFFLDLYHCDINKVCVENPRGIMGKFFRKPDQELHPYYFGGQDVKRTCLWLKNLPPLLRPAVYDMPDPVTTDWNGKNRYYVDSVSSSNKKHRTKFFKVIAEAMAEQWG